MAEPPGDSAPPAAVERLEHMLAAADAVAGYVARGRATFDADPAVLDAVLYQLVVLGEAAKAALQADPSLRAHFPDVPWSPMARVRVAMTRWLDQAGARGLAEIVAEVLGALQSVVADAPAHPPTLGRA